MFNKEKNKIHMGIDMGVSIHQPLLSVEQYYFSVRVIQNHSYHPDVIPRQIWIESDLNQIMGVSILQLLLSV